MSVSLSHHDDDDLDDKLALMPCILHHTTVLSVLILFFIKAILVSIHHYNEFGPRFSCLTVLKRILLYDALADFFSLI